MNKDQILKEITDACVVANPYIQSKDHYSTGNNLRCSRCGEPDTYENRMTCKKGTIRPIQLSDVLMAIGRDIDEISLRGRYLLIPFDAIDIQYDIKEPLSNQSLETLEFIYKLIK